MDAYDSQYNHNLTYWDFDTSEILKPSYSKPHVSLITFLSLLFVLSLVTNIILLLQQCRNTLNRGTVRFMLINLAVVNIFCSFFSILFMAVNINVFRWYAGNFMCKLLMFLAGFEVYVRPFSCVGLLMAYITEQATRKSGKTIALFFIVPVWISGAILCIPRIGIFEERNEFDPPICSNVMDDWAAVALRLHQLSQIVLGYFFPTVITLILCCVYCAVGKSNPGQDAAIVSYNPSTTTCNDKENETTHIYPPEHPNDEIDLTPSTATKAPHSRSSNTNIQPRSHLPLIIGIVSVVFCIPTMIISAYNLFFYHLWHTVWWMYAVSMVPIFITGIIAVIWHVCKKTNSETGFSFSRII